MDTQHVRMLLKLDMVTTCQALRVDWAQGEVGVLANYLLAVCSAEQQQQPLQLVRTAGQKLWALAWQHGVANITQDWILLAVVAVHMGCVLYDAMLYRQ